MLDITVLMGLMLCALQELTDLPLGLQLHLVVDHAWEAISVQLAQQLQLQCLVEWLLLVNYLTVIFWLLNIIALLEQVQC